jgi:hypothetical protein
MKISSVLFAAILCLFLGTIGCGGTGNSAPAIGNNQAGGGAQALGSPGGSTTTTNVAPGTLPTPPAQAVSFTSLQTSSDWGSCNTNSCSGGSGAGTYWIAQNQSTPSLSGSSMELDNSGVWGDALWWNKLGPQPSASNFLWTFAFQVDDASLSAAQALEFDAFQFLGGYNYMMGTECNYASGVWDLWDSAAGHWKPTSVPCPQFQPNVWHHVTLFTQRSTASAGYTFVTLDVDGTSYALNQSYSAENNGWDGQVGVQYQLDDNATGGAYQEWVDNVALTAW